MKGSQVCPCWTQSLLLAVEIRRFNGATEVILSEGDSSLPFCTILNDMMAEVLLSTEGTVCRGFKGFLGVLGIQHSSPGVSGGVSGSGKTLKLLLSTEVRGGMEE